MTAWTTVTTNAQEPYQELICSYPWNCATAMKIARCESTLQATAWDGGHNYGLMQVNDVHINMTPNHSVQDLYDPEINVRIAYELYLSNGWTPWVYCSGGN